MLSKYYCEKCREDVPYDIDYEVRTETVRGKKYSYRAKKVICRRCGHELLVKEIIKGNYKLLTDMIKHQGKTKNSWS